MLQDRAQPLPIRVSLCADDSQAWYLFTFLPVFARVAGGTFSSCLVISCG